MKVKIIFWIIFLLNINFGLAQNADHVFNELIISKLNYGKTTATVSPKGSGFLFKFYKNFISSQDGNGCSFYPSCSQFAAHAIVHHGLFLGTLLSFDRVTRCNGRNEAFYLPKPEFNKQFDPAK